MKKPTIDTDNQNGNSIFSRLKSSWSTFSSWVKDHPLLTTAIIGGIVTAGIFTGGILFIPMALMGFISAGCCIVTAIACFVQSGNTNSYVGASQGQHDDLISAGVDNGELSKAGWILTGVACIGGALVSRVLSKPYEM